MKLMLESWVRFLSEGIHDKSILKVVFMAGGPGSGKSYVSSFLFDYDKDQSINTMTQSGLKLSNIDTAYTIMLKQQGIDPSKLGDLPEEEFNKINYGPYSTREKARSKTDLMMNAYVRERLGVLIDGTGADKNKIMRIKKLFDNAGYDSMMVFVHADLEVSLQRNRKRSRSLPDNLVEDLWHNVHDNLKFYDNVFGENFVYVDNTSISPQKLREAKRKVEEFLSAPVQNPIGQTWLDSQKKMI